MAVVRELMAVGPTSAELFVDGEVRRHEGLAPDSDLVIDGVALRTLADVGALLARVVTVNDVHFGEVECGKFDGVASAVFAVGPHERPYPEVMSEAVIADVLAVAPDAVLVKGDLTSFGTLEEYQRFLDFYPSAFGDRLTWVRGNHDSYPGGTYADWPVQVVDVPGLRVVLLDTSRRFEPSGFVGADQVAAVEEAARTAPDTVIVMGHHPLYVPGTDHDRHFDGVRAPDTLELVTAMARHDNVVAYTAGHSHRCRRHELSGVAVVEVACVKDFPGAWAEYLVGTRGVAQVVHRASAPAAVAWAERTRGMFDGYYGAYALGELADRCFVLPRERRG
jgi:3',5'-cyclic AMP phosphodiesterase CpdA